MKAQEQDSLGQKMFLQQLSTPCFHGAVVKAPLPGSQFPLMMVALIIANRDRLQSVKRIRAVMSENRNVSHAKEIQSFCFVLFFNMFRF